MPAGSGGGGGGGFGGGGFYGGGYGYGGYYGYYRGHCGEDCCKYPKCTVAVISASATSVTLTLGVILTLIFVPVFFNPTGSDIYASRDTAILSYSSKLCDSLRITGSSFSEKGVQATLYLLENEPTNTKQELIYFSRVQHISKEYHFWFFHLLPNSRISINACSLNSLNVVFYFIKGTTNFARWRHNSAKHFEDSMTVDEPCSGDGNDMFFQYDVQSDDQYYMVFYSKNTVASVFVAFNITQVLYTVSSDTVTSNCSISYSSDSCSLPVAYSSHKLALVQLEPMEGSAIDWDANNEVRLSCHRRIWIHVVIGICSAVGIFLLSAIIPLVIYVCSKREKLRNKNINLPEEAVSTDSSSYNIKIVM